MARIERMERRLQMVKKDGAESRPSQTPRRREPEAETTASDDVQHSEGRVQTPKQMHFGRGGKSLKRYDHDFFLKNILISTKPV